MWDSAPCDGLDDWKTNNSPWKEYADPPGPFMGLKLSAESWRSSSDYWHAPTCIFISVSEANTFPYISVLSLLPDPPSHSRAEDDEMYYYHRHVHIMYFDRTVFQMFALG